LAENSPTTMTSSPSSRPAGSRYCFTRNIMTIETRPRNRVTPAAVDHDAVVGESGEALVAVEVVIPATFVSAGWGTPTACARHGEPAAETRKVRFVNRTSRWALLGVHVGLVLLVVAGRAGWVTIAGGAATDDGLAVRFGKAHETFAAQAAAAQRAAAQHYAAQR
jgi:hypothetical protein